MAFAIIEKKPGAAANRVDQQIQVAIAVHIREDAPGGKLSGAGHASRVCDVLEFPVAKVSIEFVAAFQTAKVEIASSIAVNIAASDTGTVESNLIRGGAGVGENIGEEDAGECG